MFKTVSKIYKILKRREAYSFYLILMLSICFLCGCDSKRDNPLKKNIGINKVGPGTQLSCSDSVIIDNFFRSHLHKEEIYNPSAVKVDSSKHSYEYKVSISDSTIADHFFKTISQIDVVKKQGKSNLGYIIILRDVPSKENDYYWIQVCINGKYRFEVLYNFYCYSKTNEIYYLNTATNEKILIRNNKFPH